MRMKFKVVWEFSAWEREGLLWRYKTKNLITTEGLNDVLTQYFKGSAYTAGWYVGIVRSDNFGTFAAADVASKIVTGVPGVGDNQWRESTAYTQGTRPALTLGSASMGSIDNGASLATFNINATLTLNGGFLSSSSTKGGTSGKLFGEALAVPPQNLVNTNILTIKITILAAGA